MKFIHLSDLHIGKRFCEASLIEDQEYILNNIIKVIDEEVTEDDKFAAPAKRNAINDDNVSIVWE